MRRFMRLIFVACSLAMLSGTTQAIAQSAVAQNPAAGHPDAAVSSAPVEVDGVALFKVLGVPAFPAEERAAAIAGRIEAVAADRSFDAAALQVVETDLGSSLMAGPTRLMNVTDDDARIENVDRKVLAAAYLTRVSNAIQDWRAARAPESIRRSILHALLATVVFAVSVALIFWLSRRLRRSLEH